MIKVEHTKIHTPSYGDRQYRNAPNEVLVTEAKLVLIKYSSGFYKDSPKNNSVLNPKNEDLKGLIALNGNTYRPILISETEKIEKGDAYYNIPSGRIYLHTYDVFRDKYSGNNVKILALPEHFSPQQLQMTVDGKLKDGDKVLVECEKTHEVGERTVLGQPIIEINQIKLNPQLSWKPNITIYPVEEKKYTIKEIIDELKYGLSKYGCKNEISGKWVLEDNIYYILNGLNKT